MEKKLLPVIQTEPEACCGPAVRPNIQRQEAEKAAAMFAALADPTRLAILNLLTGSESSEVCVCDITDSFSLGQPTISHHLRILREAGLITGEKRGKWVYYSPVNSKIAEVKHLLEKIAPAALLMVP